MFAATPRHTTRQQVVTTSFNTFRQQPLDLPTLSHHLCSYPTKSVQWVKILGPTLLSQELLAYLGLDHQGIAKVRWEIICEEKVVRLWWYPRILTQCYAWNNPRFESTIMSVGMFPVKFRMRQKRVSVLHLLIFRQEIWRMRRCWSILVNEESYPRSEHLRYFLGISEMFPAVFLASPQVWTTATSTAQRQSTHARNTAALQQIGRSGASPGANPTQKSWPLITNSI